MNEQPATVTPDAAWIHPFERMGLGTAPFQVIGYSVEKYQAIPGDRNCPIQCGTSCDVCGTGIMHVYRVVGADGRGFKVGCDCVAKTTDTALYEGARRERRRQEREWRLSEWETRGKAERDARAAAESAAKLARAERNATTMAWVIEGAATVAASANVGAWDRRVADMVYRELTAGDRGGITDKEWQVLQIGYAAAMAPMSAHVGAAGERLRGIVALYEGGPTIGIDSTYGPSVLGKFRIMEGPAAGSILVWKTKYHPARVGSLVTVTGTIDKEAPHQEYQGTKQTRVARCKVETVNEDRCMDASQR